MANSHTDPLLGFIMAHRLPILREGGVGYRQVLQSYLDELLSSLGAALSSSEARFVGEGAYADLERRFPELRDNCALIISAARAAERSDLRGVMDSVDALMARLRPHLRKKPISKLHIHSDIGTQEDIVFWYRMRKGRHAERRELFHVPWSKRKVIGPNRYSIPGQPCLYLSSQVQTPWYELGMPSVATVAAFEDVESAIRNACEKMQGEARIAETLGRDPQVDPDVIRELDELRRAIRPCMVVDFTLPTSYSPDAPGSIDFVNKVIGQYNQARAVAAGVPQPSFPEEEARVLEAQGVRLVPVCHTEEEANRGVVDYVMTLPLIAACSVAAADSSRPFVEEYVFPQQVLLWVIRQGDIDGIAYRSCSKVADSRLLNSFDIAIPADDLPRDSADVSPKLASMFVMSEPRTFEVAGDAPTFEIASSSIVDALDVTHFAPVV